MVHEEAVIRERRRQRRCLDGEYDDGEDGDGDDTGWLGRLLSFVGQNKKRSTTVRRVESIESIVEEEMPQVS